MKKQANGRWMLLDNAAKMYPASKRRNWINIFRVSVSFTEEIDRNILTEAITQTIPRFPSIAARLRRGMFWYYLEECKMAPPILEEGPYPFVGISYEEMMACCFRVVVFKNRLALEFFHVVTDGNGAMIFLKTIAAQYIRLKYGVSVPGGDGVLDISEPVKDSEIEDSFVRFKGKVTNKVKGPNSFHVAGTKEPDGYATVTRGIVPVEDVLAVAKKYNVSLTVFLASVMIESLMEIQNEKQPIQTFRKPVHVLIPVNLRKHFDSETLRNFVLYVIPGINPAWGSYTFEEIVSQVYHQMGAEITGKHFNTRFAGNVHAEENPVVKVIPLFIKNIILRIIWDKNGEKKSCLSISNLGNVTIPEEMKPYVSEFDFILGNRASTPNNCGVISYDGRMHISFIRSIKEPVLEYKFFSKLRKMGISVKIDSNARGEGHMPNSPSE